MGFLASQLLKDVAATASEFALFAEGCNASTAAGCILDPALGWNLQTPLGSIEFDTATVFIRPPATDTRRAFNGCWEYAHSGPCWRSFY